MSSLLYPDEPNRFTGPEFEKFAVWAANNQVSDITIQNEEQIICEVHSKLKRVTKKRLSLSEITEIIAYIYKSDGALAILNSADDIDGEWNIKVNRNESKRFRYNMVAGLVDQQRGYQLTIRTINNKAQPLESLGVPEDLKEAMCAINGLGIVVGPTGSGKSTFLTSVMDWRLRQKDANIKVITFEHPIEATYDETEKPSSSMFQSQIGPHLKSFAAGVRNALRRKPNVILLGEMRDLETMREGIVAANTGHLVYGTLHSKGVASTPRRMIALFPTEEKNGTLLDVIDSLRFIVAQLLIPTIDGKRVAIREYLIFNDDIREFILKNGIDNITESSKLMLEKHGQTFLQDAEKKFNDGIINEKELNKIKTLSKAIEKDLKKSIEDDKWERI